MSNEFRGRTISEAVRKAVARSNRPRFRPGGETKARSCREITRDIRNLEDEIRDSAEQIEFLMSDAEQRSRALGSRARDAAVSFGVDLLVLATGIDSLLRTVRSFRAAIGVVTGGALAGEALGLRRNTEAFFSRLEPIGEALNIAGLRTQIVDLSARIYTKSRQLELEWRRFEAAGCLHAP